MDAADLYRWINDPALLAEASLDDLRGVVEAYPFFHTAKLLYLKKLSLAGDASFAAELQRLSPGVGDRKQLFLLVEGDRYGLPFMPPESPEAEGDAFSLIDAFLSGHREPEPQQPTGEEAKPVDSFIQPTAATDYFHWAQSEGEEAQPTATEDAGAKLRHQDWIDSFIAEDERRAPGRGFRFQPERPEDKSQAADAKEHDAPKLPGNAYFTETLARIYVKQKRYEKALQIIRGLSLKYPEKNIYFADQIRFLEKLIINTKK